MAPETETLLTDDHRELDRLLLETLQAIESENVEDAFHKLDFFWARLAMHIRAEHLRLFPAVLELANNANLDGKPLPADIPEIINDLHRDHDFFMRELARAIKAMRLVFYFGNEQETFAIVKELLTRVGRRLATHNRLEEETIYPLATRPAIGPDASTTLSKTVQQEIQKLPPRFKNAF